MWWDVFEHWDLIEVDLHRVFGVDIESGILTSRSYRWLMVRVSGLLAVSDSLLLNRLFPVDKKTGRRQRR